MNWKIDNLLSNNYTFKLLLIISISFFILGISLPVFASTKFFFWREDISLLKSVRILFDDGNYFLAIIILLFTFVFPILKYLLLLITVFDIRISKKDVILSYLSTLGKWSMLDVFVIAMLILTFKLKSGLFAIEMRSGTIFFTIAVISSVGITFRLKKI